LKSYVQDSSEVDGNYDYSWTPTHGPGQEGEPLSFLDPNDPQNPFNKNLSNEDLNRRDFMFRNYVGGLELINEAAEDDDVSISSRHLSELADDSKHNQTVGQSLKLTDMSPEPSFSRGIDSNMASGRGRQSSKRIKKMGSKRRSQETGNMSGPSPHSVSKSMSQSNMDITVRKTITDMDESSNSQNKRLGGEICLGEYISMSISPNSINRSRIKLRLEDSMSRARGSGPGRDEPSSSTNDAPGR
jgi:hypothetical protein